MFNYEDSSSGSKPRGDKELSTSHPNIHDNDDDSTSDERSVSGSHESTSRSNNNNNKEGVGITNNGTVIVAPDSMKAGVGNGKVLRLLADTVEEAEGWIKALTMAINEANKRENIFISAAMNKINQGDSSMNGLSTSSPFISLNPFPQASTNSNNNYLSPRTPIALKAWGGAGGTVNGVFDFNMGAPTELQKAFFALKYSTSNNNNNNNSHNNSSNTGNIGISKSAHTSAAGTPTMHNNLRPPPVGGISVLTNVLRKPLAHSSKPPSTPPPLPPHPVGAGNGPPLAYILGSVQTNSDILYFLLHVLLDANELLYKVGSSNSNNNNNNLVEQSISSTGLPPPPSSALRNRSPSPGLPPRSINPSDRPSDAPFSYSNNNTNHPPRNTAVVAAAAVAAAQSSALTDETSSFFQLMRVLGEQETRKRHQRTASVLDERWISNNNGNNANATKEKDSKLKSNKDKSSSGSNKSSSSRSNNNNNNSNKQAPKSMVAQAKATRFLTDTIIEEYDVDEMPPPPTVAASAANNNANYSAPDANEGYSDNGQGSGRKSSHRKSLSEVSSGDIERARALLSMGLGGGLNVRNKGSRKQRKMSGNKNGPSTLKRSQSSVASSSSTLTIAQRLEEMNKKMDNFRSLVKRLSKEEKSSITLWLCQSGTRESIASIFCTNDVLAHDAALRVLWLSFLLQRLKDEIKHLKELHHHHHHEEGGKGGGNKGALMIDYLSVEAAASGHFALFVRSTVLPIIPSSSLVLKCLHSLLTMMVTDISSFTRFTVADGFFQPIRNPSLFFPLFSSLSYSSDFFIRKRLLKDLLSLFHLRPLNYTNLLLQKGWQKWLFLLLADIPRLSLHPAGSNQVSPLFKKIITQIMFLFTLLHFHSFLSHNNEGEGGAGGGGGNSSNNNNKRIEKDPTPSFDAVIAPSLLLSMLASPPDDLSLPRSILLSLIIKLSYNTVLFHSSLSPNDPRNNRRSSLYDLSPSHSRSTSASASVSSGLANKSNKANFSTLGLNAGGGGNSHRLIGVEEADDGELSYESDVSESNYSTNKNMNTISKTYIPSTTKNYFDRPSVSSLQSESSLSSHPSSSNITAGKYYVPPPAINTRLDGHPVNSTNKKAELDFVMWCHLLHLLTLIKCFVFNPARLYEILNNNVTINIPSNNNNNNNQHHSNTYSTSSTLSKKDDAPDPSLPPERPSITLPTTSTRSNAFYSASPSFSASASSGEHSSKNAFFDASAALFSPGGVMVGGKNNNNNNNKSRSHSSGFTSSAGDAYVVAFNRIADLPLPQPISRLPLIPNHSSFKSSNDYSSSAASGDSNNNSVPNPPFGPFTKSLINQLETSFYGTFSPSSSSSFRLHLSETNGLAADIELLSHTLHLLETLATEHWSFDNYFSSDSASLISQRLAAEISFFQDSIAFLSIVSPMHSKSSSLFLSGNNSSSAFLSVSDISDVIYSFLGSKTSLSRQKIFKEYEIKYKEKQKQLEKQAKVRSKLLDMQMVADAAKESKISKVLLLGAGESGKSTLFKQIQRKYGEGFNITERKKYLFIIFNNIVRCMKSLIYHSDRLLTRVPFSSLSNLAGASTTSISMEGEESKLFISYLNIDDYFDYQLNAQGKPIPQWLTYAKDGQTPAYSIMKDILLHIHKLWTEEKGIQVTFENRALFDRFQLFDSDGFFLNKLADIIEPPLSNEGGGSGGGVYIPIEEDIIRVRQRTTGIVEYNFQLDHQWFRLLDVAGQRSERRKWIQHFGEVTGVIFVAAISEYDQVLCEDAKTNRLLESITLFAEIVNCHWFKQTPVVLFLNKRDLFAEKIKKVPLNVCFPKYRDEQEYQAGIKFIKKEFLKKRKDKNKIVYVHVVCAVDPDNIQKAMNSVKDTLIQSSLGLAGLA